MCDAEGTLLLGASGQIGQALRQQWRRDEGPLYAAGRNPAQSDRLLDLSCDPLPSCRAIISAGPLDLLVQALQRTGRMPGLQRVVAFSSTSALTKASSPSAAERALARRLQQAELGLQDWCDKQGVEWVLIRPTLVHGGPNRNLQRVARWLKRYGVVPCQQPAQGLRQPVHARELAWLARTCLRKDAAANRCWLAGGGETLTYLEMLRRVQQAVGCGRIMALPGWLLWPLRGLKPEIHAMLQRQQQDLCVDDQDTRKHLGWNPGPFQPKREELCE